jgi:uncharacterized protein YuzE
MRILYDPDVDALTIELRDAPWRNGTDLEEGVIAHYDPDGHVVALEIHNASAYLAGAPPGAVTIERLVSERSAVD